MCTMTNALHRDSRAQFRYTSFDPGVSTAEDDLAAFISIFQRGMPQVLLECCEKCGRTLQKSNGNFFSPQKFLDGKAT